MTKLSTLKEIKEFGKDIIKEKQYLKRAKQVEKEFWEDMNKEKEKTLVPCLNQGIVKETQSS